MSNEWTLACLRCLHVGKWMESCQEEGPVGYDVDQFSSRPSRWLGRYAVLQPHNGTVSLLDRPRAYTEESSITSESCINGRRAKSALNHARPLQPLLFA